MTQENLTTVDRPSRGPLIVLGFIGAVATLLAGVCIFFIAKGLLAAHDQRAVIARAVPTPAVVTDARVSPAHEPPAASTRRRGRGRAPAGSEPLIAFEYSYNGTAHSTDTVWPLRRRGSAAWARAIAAKYPQNSHVTALVDPMHPDRAFLEPLHAPEPYLAAATGGCALAILALIACLCLAASPRTRGRAWTFAAWTAVTSGILIPACACMHYVMVCRGDVHPMVIPGAIAYVSLVAVLVYLALRHKRRLARAGQRL